MGLLQAARLALQNASLLQRERERRGRETDDGNVKANKNARGRLVQTPSYDCKQVQALTRQLSK